MRKKLGVCGDSFYASLKEDSIYPGHGLHFTELVAKELNCDLITYARGGCSNQAIRLQIDEVIKHQPDFVIVGITSSDRIEIPYKEQGKIDYGKKVNDDCYNKELGIYNIDYQNFADQSSIHEGFIKNTPTLRSETIINILNGTINLYNPISKEMTKSVEYYFDFMYDSGWKKQQDSWIIANGVHKLIENNINFCVVLSNLYPSDFSFCKENIIDANDDKNPSKHWSNDKNVPYPFHLTIEDEIMLSKLWYEYLKNRI